ncbi:MAG: dTDP-glucose 4,6-dehydratase [Nitrososphaerales archaeon]
MRVVLTGGAGFIGSNLARYWRSHYPEDSLVVLDALTYAGRKESLTDLLDQPMFEFVHEDILNATRVSEVLRGTELVIHLAAETHNDRAAHEPLPFVTANALGTASLLEACRKADVPRFHHVSTDEVFGSLALDSPERFSEQSPYHPRGPYSASKAAADHFVRAWSETYGLRYTLSNCGNNFGPYQYPEKLIALSITRSLRGRKIPLYGDGKNVRDWIFVEDHCSAVDLITHRGRVGSTYVVSAETELSNEQVLHRLLAVLGKDWGSVERVPDRPGHDRRYALDPTRLKRELGWSARFGFDDALRSTVDWYRQNEPWWSPLLGPGDNLA